MAYDKGLGTCLIPKANGQLCSKQIAEGEAIGTVIVGVTPLVGHKDCASNFTQRQADKKKEQSVVKRVDQSGPGGAVDMSQAKDATLGSIPLEKSPNPVSVSNDPPQEPPSLSLAETPLPEGVKSVTEVPFTETPKDTWAVGRPAPIPKEEVYPPAEAAGPVLASVAGMTLDDFKDTGSAARTEIDNRFRYHPPSPDNARIHGLVRDKVRDVALLFLDVCPASKEREAAINALDSAVMLANAAIARHS